MSAYGDIQCDICGESYYERDSHICKEENIRFVIEQLRTKLEEAEKNSTRYEWLKTANKEQLLIWRGTYACSGKSIDEAISQHPTEKQE